MVQTIQAKDLALYEVEEKFNLQRSFDSSSFLEWQENLPSTTETERQWLDQVKADFLSLERYPLHEEVVKMAVLSPLLFFARFFHHPFYPRAEVEVTIAAEDEGAIVQGKVDVLILRQRLWVTVIEPKNKAFSLAKATPQALLYMMSSSAIDKPIFGLVTNGSHFIFIKLLKQSAPQYILSDEFSLYRQDNELYTVLSILRRLGELVTE
ncbi:MAG: restriction endonuclease subunit R [Oscillatoriales cyanobacterium C42_A2020_001]|nr:restriction endonuclease subunit R [Leptolyngbyaceae cyanobacterium C42_A2020_001]